MRKEEKNVRSIFASVVHLEKFAIPLYKSIREFVADRYWRQIERIPLIFLSKDAYEKLISPEVEYYEPNVEVMVETIGNYIYVKVQTETFNDFNNYVYIIKQENSELYSIRGFIGIGRHCFAPNDIDKEHFKRFIGDTCVAYYYQNVKFDYPLYIGW